MEPQITPSYYTTSDAVISTETVFIVEISLTCKNRVQVRQQGFSQEVLGQEVGSEPGAAVSHWQLMGSDPPTHTGRGRVRIPTYRCRRERSGYSQARPFKSGVTQTFS